MRKSTANFTLEMPVVFALRQQRMDERFVESCSPPFQRDESHMRIRITIGWKTMFSYILLKGSLENKVSEGLTRDFFVKRMNRIRCIVSN